MPPRAQAEAKTAAEASEKAPTRAGLLRPLWIALGSAVLLAISLHWGLRRFLVVPLRVPVELEREPPDVSQSVSLSTELVLQVAREHRGSLPARTQPEYESKSREHSPPAHVDPASERDVSRLLSRMDELGTVQGPIVIGGIGDSGTRGARSVVMHLGGTQMLAAQDVNPLSKDSQIFMARYAVRDLRNRTEHKGPAGFYNPGIKGAHSLDYNASSMSASKWSMGRQFVAQMVLKSMETSHGLREPGARLDPWGFKHPRTALVLPLLHSVLGERFKFIHVLRDGKDVAMGDNNRLFREQCAKYYGRQCPNTLLLKTQFWSDLNFDVARFALRELGPRQYFPVRIEDLVTGDRPCFERLAHFLLDDVEDFSPTGADFDGRVTRAIQANAGHGSSYNGKKWSPDEKQMLWNHVPHSNRTREALRFWGYGQQQFGVQESCTEFLDRLFT